MPAGFSGFSRGVRAPMMAAVSAAPDVRFSLVIPCHNEAGNIGPLLRAARSHLSQLPGESEIIVVDDGSTDSTPREAAQAVAGDPNCRIITFPANRGQAAALWHGLQQARGRILLTMDGDGQNDPEDFPPMLTLLETGAADLVCGWRRDRRDPLPRLMLSRLGNAARRLLLRDGVTDGGCQIRVFRREVLAHLQPGPMFQSFLPAQAAAAGCRVLNHPVTHHPRRHGMEHYGLRNLSLMPAQELLRHWRRQHPRA